MKTRITLLLFVMGGIGFSLVCPSPTAAQVVALPGAADAGRIKPPETIPVPDRSQDQKTVIAPPPPQGEAMPSGVQSIFLTLKKLDIEGMTAFTQEQMADIYAPFIGKEVPLEFAWIAAESITDRYHHAGYFLSRAYVPQQSIKDGIITIKVIEGYVGKVTVPGELSDSRVVREYIDRLVAQKPVTIDAVDSFLLRLNDLPGYSFRSVLSPLADKGEDEPAVELALEPAGKDNKGSISFDNYSSRYLGPNEATVAYSASVLPLQQTSVSALSAVPMNRLRYGTLDHTVAVAPDISLEVSGGVTKAFPGYTLEREDIESLSTTKSASVNYQWIRQREENLALKATLDEQDVDSDILGHTSPLTRDYIRALRFGATYDGSDGWNGYNIVSITLSQGIDGLGSSNKGDPNLSSPHAVPEFTKADLSVSRLQGITTDWSVYASASAQAASDVLYSSEQFGYGGQAFGRAYDASDITGDKGAAGSLELRYGGWGAWQPVGLQPYAFYDIGKIWDKTFGMPSESGASAGFGMRFTTPWNESANLGVAWPLTRSITDPIIGEGKREPRLLFQISQEFK